MGNWFTSPGGGLVDKVFVSVDNGDPDTVAVWVKFNSEDFFLVRHTLPTFPGDEDDPVAFVIPMLAAQISQYLFTEVLGALQSLSAEIKVAANKPSGHWAVAYNQIWASLRKEEGWT